MTDSTAKSSAMAAILRGGLQGLSMGNSDELDAGIHSLFGDDYKTRRDALRADNTQSAADHPYLYKGAQIVGGALPMAGLIALTGGAASPLVSTLGGSLIAGAVQGGLQGAGYSDADKPGDVADDAVQGAATGAVFNGLFHEGGTALRSVANSRAVAKAAAAAKLLREDRLPAANELEPPFDPKVGVQLDDSSFGYEPTAQPDPANKSKVIADLLRQRQKQVMSPNASKVLVPDYQPTASPEQDIGELIKGAAAEDSAGSKPLDWHDFQLKQGQQPRLPETPDEYDQAFEALKQKPNTDGPVVDLGQFRDGIKLNSEAARELEEVELLNARLKGLNGDSLPSPDDFPIAEPSPLPPKGRVTASSPTVNDRNGRLLLELLSGAGTTAATSRKRKE